MKFADGKNTKKMRLIIFWQIKENFGSKVNKSTLTKFWLLKKLNGLKKTQNKKQLMINKQETLIKKSSLSVKNESLLLKPIGKKSNNNSGTVWSPSKEVPGHKKRKHCYLKPI